MLRRIYGPVNDKGEWRIRTNRELYQLCDEKDIVRFCKLSRLRWAGHVMRQDDDDLARRVLLSEPGGKRPRGRPRLCWEDGVKGDVAKLGCRNWTVATRNRKGWRKLEGGGGPPWAVAPLEEEEEEEEEVVVVVVVVVITYKVIS